MSCKYYVYLYIDPISKEIKYVGKGVRNRIYSHYNLIKNGNKTSNKRFSNWLYDLHNNDLKPIIVKAFKGLSSSEALIIEHNIINKYGRYNYDKNGVLLNHSIGFEHFNVDTNDKEELCKYLKEIDTTPHFNSKVVPSEIELFIVSKYNDGTPLRKLRELILNKFEYGISHNTVRKVLTDKNIHIRTKSETRMGELNPCYGRRGFVTKGFSGRKHTEESKKKISKTLKGKSNE